MAELKRLYADGLSYTEIGKEVDRKRNAVASKIRRLKLPTRSGLPRTPPAEYSYRPHKPKPKQPKRKRYTYPENTSPLIRFLFDELNRQDMSVMELGVISGVSHVTIYLWRTKSNATIQNLEACFNVLGFTMLPVPFEVYEGVNVRPIPG